MECIPTYRKKTERIASHCIGYRWKGEIKTKQFSSKLSNLFYGKSFGHSHVYFILVFTKKLGRGANWCFNCHPCNTWIFYYKLLLIQHF